jgi:hypothetical protein
MLGKVLEAEIRVQGPEHPDTLRTKHCLAELLRGQGELSRAREMYEEVLEARIRVLGSEHPRTNETREALRKLQDSKAATPKEEPKVPQTP